MKPLIENTTVIDDRRYKISWFDPPSRPPLEQDDPGAWHLLHGRW
jgi:hypothetical protein